MVKIGIINRDSQKRETRFLGQNSLFSWLDFSLKMAIFTFLKGGTFRNYQFFTIFTYFTILQ